MRQSLFLIPLLFLYCKNSDDKLVVGANDLEGRSAITTKASYVAGEAIAVSFANERESAMYLQTCCGPLSYCIDRLESDEWTEYHCSDMPCVKMCMGVAILVTRMLPHQERIDAEIDQKGTYRFRFLFNEDSGTTRELASNTFTVE